MIKLIVSDMDGTLLNDQKGMDEEIFEIIPKLKEKGIRFMAASGRQYPSLQTLFQAHIKDMVLIAENGAFVVSNQKELYSSVMEQDLIHHCIDEIGKIEGTETLLCAKYTSYTTDSVTYHMMQSPKFHYNIKLVDNLYDVKDDIIKVSFVDMAKIGAEKNGFARMLPLVKERAEIAVSGFNCVDIVNKGVSKGTAIEAIQKEWGISTEETMAFGDNYNDVEMLGRAKYSFAMENAEAGVKKHAKFMTGTNNEGSVVKEIRRLTGI